MSAVADIESQDGGGGAAKESSSATAAAGPAVPAVPAEPAEPAEPTVLAEPADSVEAAAGAAIDPRPYYYPPGKSRYAMSKDVGPPPCYKRRVGNFYVCCDRRDADGVEVPCCMFGPCWPMMLMTMSLILGSGAAAAGAFGWVLVRTTEGALVLAGGLFFVVFTAVCFGCTACRNPGIYPRSAENVGGEMIWHEESQSFRPRRNVQWDNESRVLAYKIDHFCPWTGTLIARGNFFFFNFFTSCLMFACIGVAVIVIFGFVNLTASPP